jgi:glycosyltransferase involved in cell wall biosynthesis
MESMELEGVFKKTTIILPVMNETHSLIKTMDIIERECGQDILEYIFVVCAKTLDESLKVIRSYLKINEKRYIFHQQGLPFLGGAIREAFNLARGSHVVMMASDLETNPQDVKYLIQKTKEFPKAIITASRWIGDSGFKGYNPIKLILNFFFQGIFSFLYRTKLTDMTYGYRIFPTPLVKKIHWEELKHPFLFETILKPLRLGVKVFEIPSRWTARIEGESQNTFFANFKYFKIGLKVRFYPLERILKNLDSPKPN